MSNNNQVFTMYSGDSKNLNLIITKEDGSALDISGASFVYTLVTPTQVTKDSTSGSIKITDALNGKVTVYLDPPDTDGITGNYKHWVKMTDVNDKDSTVFDDIIKIINR